MNKMIDADWAKLVYFKPSEAWGNPKEMDRTLVFTLEAMRAFTERYWDGARFIVLCGYALKGHSKESQHYKGKAVDGRFVNRQGKVLSALDQFIIASRFSFTGIGVYQYVKGQGEPFLHLDVRPLPAFLYPEARWGCWVTRKGDGGFKHKYVALEADFFLKEV